jgi:hypothetical protein
MLFRVFEPYNDINNTNKDEIIIDECVDECFICLEVNYNNETPIYLKKQYIYITLCNCDGFVHKNCLNNWFKERKKCPICRINVTENSVINYDFQLSLIMYSYYIFLLKIIYNISKLLLIYSIIYLNLCIFFIVIYNIIYNINFILLYN